MNTIEERLKAKAISEAYYSGQILDIEDDEHMEYFASATAQVFYETTQDDELTPGTTRYEVILSNLNIVTE
jgi:hypothetical protein